MKQQNKLKMLDKFKTVVWFLKRPQYLSQIEQVLRRNENKALEETSVESKAWCQEKCITQEEALNKLAGVNNAKTLDIIFPNKMQEARNIAEKCPIKMGGEGATAFLYHLVEATKPKKLVETGVAYGWSSLAILLAIKNDPDAKLISNDMPYIKMNNDDYVGCIIPEKLRAKWELQRLPDVRGIPIALKKFNNQIDFCHYDSDKSYTARMWASPLLWDALKIGGFFVSDDINDNLAFKHFCESVNKEPAIIEHLGKYVGVLKK